MKEGGEAVDRGLSLHFSIQPPAPVDQRAPMRFLGIVPKVAAVSAPYAFLALYPVDFFQFTEPGAPMVTIGWFYMRKLRSGK
ncbi:hypothetical protein [Thermococcus sp. 2319x1]|uniref:hypothetical protein n=1 Tax=Thermococcus sp. 2319x1 TaxID=1674923 RepID=UPI0015840680|nr:hypothetical protein [Thermococcus sp. 2319x1]